MRIGKLIKSFSALVIISVLITPALAIPRVGGVYENSVDTLVFSGQRKVIRGKFSKEAQVKFTTNGGQEIDFQVTKVRRKNGVTRLNYLVPSIGINDANGDSLTGTANGDLYVISGQLEVLDKRLISNQQNFDMLIYVRPNTEPNSVTISTTANGGNLDTIYSISKVE